MNIALISPRSEFFHNPFMGKYWNSSGMKLKYFMWTGISPALLVIAALTPPDFEIEIIDENEDVIDFDKNYDIVGISFMTQLATRAYEIADQFRKKGTTVVLGGIHATILPNESAEHADSVIVGEAEYLWSEFIRDFLNGQVKKIYKTDKIVELIDSPIPRYDLIKNKGYKTIWVQTTRGCPHDCEFCAASNIYGKHYRSKSIGQIVNELNVVKKTFGNNIFIGFGDDNFLINEKTGTKLLKKIVKLKINWMAQTDIGIGKKTELLELLKESGCLLLLIGLESLSPNNLKTIDQWKFKHLSDYSKWIAAIQSFGISVMGGFIVGLDEDDEQVFERIENFIIDNNIHDELITILTPLPGTRLRKRLELEKRILPTSWENYTFFKANIIHKKLTKEQLENGIFQIYEHVNSPEVQAKKFENFKTIYKKLNKLSGECIND